MRALKIRHTLPQRPNMKSAIQGRPRRSSRAAVRPPRSVNTNDVTLPCALSCRLPVSKPREASVRYATNVRTPA
jgi:hypothetical protein